MTMLVSGVSILVINVAGTPYMPSPIAILARVIAVALVSTMIANIGVHISLRVKTVREAQQTLSLVFVLAPISLIFILPAARPCHPGISQYLCCSSLFRATQQALSSPDPRDPHPGNP